MDARIFCFWLGDQPMSEQRKLCLESVREISHCEVTLITDDNLNEYIKQDAPFHEGYRYLSGTTKCDYARAYFMHHYGGGYTDIKQIYVPWNPFFKEINVCDDIWVVGYREMCEGGVAHLPVDKMDIQEQLYKNWGLLLGNGAFICRPGTPFTSEWMEELHKTMDGFLSELRKNPASHPRDCFGRDGSAFPIPWGGIGGCIFHPLCLKYAEYLSYKLCAPSFANYI